jgi:hypothetical protein
MTNQQFENKLQAAFPSNSIEFKHGRTYNRAYVHSASFPSGVRSFDNDLNSKEIHVYGASGHRLPKPWEPMTEEEEANERDWGYGE